MRRARFIAAAFAFVLFSAAQRAGADPVAYDAFVKGAEAQRGLFTVWHKDGKIYLELAPSQLEHDFVQTIVPASGLGGQGLVWGNTDHLPVELLRFERAGNTVALIWPNPSFVAPGAPAATLALARSFPRSIVALAPIAALDEKSGDVVIDAAPFLDDQLDLHGLLKDATHASGEDAYTLDRERSYFGGVKAFPKNVVIEALQAWTSPAQRLNDVPADPRNVQIRVVYNIADPPTAGDGYVPR
ncbi:MAG TPA: DUF5117 domain-containing protein, partial [Candidatus Baltobacteraceae bacterium]|nr:DUF5117 domain-containing protein [Candidatus Baltobacteraceae bacterium]